MINILNRKNMTGKQRYLFKKYRLCEIFNIKDILNYILEFLNEAEKVHMYNISQETREIVRKCNNGPVYYKLNKKFFEENISNENILKLYKKYSSLFRNKLTTEFLKPYCMCKEIEDCLKCIACKIFWYDAKSFFFLSIPCTFLTPPVKDCLCPWCVELLEEANIPKEKQLINFINEPSQISKKKITVFREKKIIKSKILYHGNNYKKDKMKSRIYQPKKFSF